MNISTTHVTIYSFIPLDLLRNISFSYSFSYSDSTSKISEIAVQHKIFENERPIQCDICEKSIKSIHYDYHKDKKSTDTIYYVSMFYNSNIFITTPYIKLCFVFNHKLNPYSDSDLMIAEQIITYPWHLSVVAYRSWDLGLSNH